MAGFIATSVSDLVGNTPLLRLSFPDVPESVRLLAKLEMFNPLSSVKDRAALNMIREAERDGRLRPGGTVIEYSSGNMGIALAAMCAARGYRYISVMPDNATIERHQMLRAFGAQIVVTDHKGGLVETIERAKAVQRSIPGSWLVDQGVNPHNAATHYVWTGPEIWTALDGGIDVLVCGVGTGGTISGTARYLKERREVHVVAVEPETSASISGGIVDAHRIPGIGPGFVQDNTDLSVIDEVLTVSDADAAATTRELAALNGLLVGISAGAATFASRTVAARQEWAGATIVTILPDTGERYLSFWDTAARAGETEEGTAA
jgi:cysteine synthase A